MSRGRSTCPERFFLLTAVELYTARLRLLISSRMVLRRPIAPADDRSDRDEYLLFAERSDSPSLWTSLDAGVCTAEVTADRAPCEPLVLDFGRFDPTLRGRSDGVGVAALGLEEVIVASPSFVNSVRDTRLVNPPSFDFPRSSASCSKRPASIMRCTHAWSACDITREECDTAAASSEGGRFGLVKVRGGGW